MLRTICEVTATLAQNIFSRLDGAQWDTGKWLGSWSHKVCERTTCARLLGKSNTFVVIAPKSGYCESNTLLLVNKQYRQP